MVALCAGIFVFAEVYNWGLLSIDIYRSSASYQTQCEEKYVIPFREYVEENSIRASDGKAISEWAEHKRNIVLKIYDGERTIFKYYYFDTRRSNYQETVFLHTDKIDDMVYPVKFADGTFQVSVNAVYSDRIYYVILIAAVMLAIGTFLIVFFAGTYKRTKYISELKDDIERLGSGDLVHEVNVKGNDELAYIADNLEQMRQALLKHMEEEDRLAKDNKEIVSKLSHDIRTPLTSMMLFADLLKEGKYQNQQQRDHYIDWIQSGAVHLTQLTDQLLQYTRDEKPAQDRERQKRTDLLPLIKQAAEELLLKGFQVETDYGAGDSSVGIDLSSAMRILDNIKSNIIRYADDKEPVRILYRARESEIVLEFQNTCRFDSASDRDHSDAESKDIGLKSIETLLRQAEGDLQVERSGDSFKIKLTVPACASHLQIKDS